MWQQPTPTPFGGRCLSSMPPPPAAEAARCPAQLLHLPCVGGARDEGPTPPPPSVGPPALPLLWRMSEDMRRVGDMEDDEWCWCWCWCCTGGTKARLHGAAARRRRAAAAAGSAARRRAGLWVRRGREAAAPPREPVGRVEASKAAMVRAEFAHAAVRHEWTGGVSPSERLQVNHNQTIRASHNTPTRARTRRRGRQLCSPPRGLLPPLRPPSPRAYPR